MVGLVVGHEIMHAFDDSGLGIKLIPDKIKFLFYFIYSYLGRMYDKHGNRRQWWTQETMETFSNKAECFVQQYNNYNLTVMGNQIKVCDYINGNFNMKVVIIIYLNFIYLFIHLYPLRKF